MYQKSRGKCIKGKWYTITIRQGFWPTPWSIPRPWKWSWPNWKLRCWQLWLSWSAGQFYTFAYLSPLTDKRHFITIDASSLTLSLESLAHLPALSASPLETLQPHREVLNEHCKVLNVHFTDARCRCSFQDLSGTLHNVHCTCHFHCLLFFLANAVCRNEFQFRAFSFGQSYSAHRAEWQPTAAFQMIWCRSTKITLCKSTKST